MRLRLGGVALADSLVALDVVQGTRITLGHLDPQGCHEWAADFNGDGVVDVTDGIQIVNEIVGLDATTILGGP
ncbi:MAG: hypothetical protein ACE5OR_06055 [bacterium]